MPYSGPPPSDASIWPFPSLLDFCLVNGLGSVGTAGQTPWTAKSFAQSSSDLSYKTVEAWLQGVNAPEEKMGEVVKILTANEPSRFRSMWERALVASCEYFRSIPSEHRKTTVTEFRAKLQSNLMSGKSFRSDLRTLGAALLADDNVKLAQFSRRRARNMSFDTANQKRALSLVKLGREARLGNDNKSSRQSLDEALDILKTELQGALNQIGLTSEAYAEKGQLSFDEGKYDEAAEDYFRAILYHSRESKETMKNIIGQFWYSVNNHIRAAQDYSTGKKLFSLSQRIALVPDRIALTQLMRLSNDFEAASKYFRLFIALGYPIDNKFATSAIMSAKTPEQVDSVIFKLKASGHELSPVSLSAALAKSAEYDDASSILEDIKKTGAELSVETYGAIMHKAPNLKTALEIEAKMRAAGIAPNSHTVSTIVEKTHGYENSKKRLLSYVQEGIKLNQFPFNILIEKAPDQKTAWEVVAVMDSCKVEVNTASIDFIVEKAENIDEAVSILKRLDYDEVMTSEFAISTMLRKSRSYSECRKYFFHYRKTIKAGTTCLCHNALLNFATNDKEKSETILLKREDGHTPSIREYGILTKLAGSFSAGRAIVERMSSDNLIPNTVICNNLLRHTRSKDEIDFVLSLSRKLNLKPDQYTLAMRVARSNSFSDAIGICVEIFQVGVKPNNVVEMKLREKMLTKDHVDEYTKALKRFNFTVVDESALVRLRESLPL